MKAAAAGGLVGAVTLTELGAIDAGPDCINRDLAPKNRRTLSPSASRTTPWVRSAFQQRNGLSDEALLMHRWRQS